MNTEEFIAWFEGFTNRIKSRPSAKDWSEIVSAVRRIEGASPVKAWFEGLLVKVKTAPSESEWKQVKQRVGEARAPGAKAKLGLNEGFKAFAKKSPSQAAPAPKSKAPGNKPFGKK